MAKWVLWGVEGGYTGFKGRVQNRPRPGAGLLGRGNVYHNNDDRVSEKLRCGDRVTTVC